MVCVFSLTRNLIRHAYAKIENDNTTQNEVIGKILDESHSCLSRFFAWRLRSAVSKAFKAKNLASVIHNAKEWDATTTGKDIPEEFRSVLQTIPNIFKQHIPCLLSSPDAYVLYKRWLIVTKALQQAEKAWLPSARDLIDQVQRSLYDPSLNKQMLNQAKQCLRQLFCRFAHNPIPNATASLHTDLMQLAQKLTSSPQWGTPSQDTTSEICTEQFSKDWNRNTTIAEKEGPEIAPKDLLAYLKKMANDDNDLYLLLQGLVSQTPQNFIVDKIFFSSFKNVDIQISPILFPRCTPQTITLEKISDQKIQMIQHLRIACVDSMKGATGQETDAFFVDVTIDVQKTDGQWHVNAPQWKCISKISA